MKTSGIFYWAASAIRSLWSNEDKRCSNVSSESSSRDIFSSTSPSIVTQPTVQTDVRIKKTRMRVRKSIDDQLKSRQVFAMKPHGADCIDILSCTRNPCFIREPDKIVSHPYIVEKKSP